MRWGYYHLDPAGGNVVFLGMSLHVVPVPTLQVSFKSRSSTSLEARTNRAAIHS
jgi:hypothetical protein